MSTHVCLRCGLESHCSRATWPDRHPSAAVALALPALVVMLGSVCAYPWLLAVIAGGIAVYMVDREHRRRAALAARADYEHHRLMATSPPHVIRTSTDTWSVPVPADPRAERARSEPPVRVNRPMLWRPISQLSTQPIHAVRN